MDSEAEPPPESKVSGHVFARVPGVKGHTAAACILAANILRSPWIAEIGDPPRDQSILDSINVSDYFVLHPMNITFSN